MKIKYLKLEFVMVAFGLLLVGIQAQPTAQQIDPNNVGQGQPNVNNNGNQAKPKYVPGRFIVKFKSTGSVALNSDAQYLLKSNGSFQGAVSDGSDSLDKLNQKHKVKNARSLFIERNGLTTADAMQKQNSGQQLSKAMHQSRSQRVPKGAIIPDLSNIYVLEVASESNIETIVQEYQADPHVEYAQPDYIMETNMVPNDPYYSFNGAWDNRMMTFGIEDNTGGPSMGYHARRGIVGRGR